MQDLLLQKNADGLYDLAIADMDFSSVDGLQSAILVSLFTDARAPDSAVADARSRRGWVGDVLTAQIGRSLGSVLWTYDQSRLTQDIRNQIAVAAQRALTWMVDDGLARSVSARVSNSSTRGVTLQIDITPISGDVQSYSVLWSNTNATGLSDI